MRTSDVTVKEQLLKFKGKILLILLDAKTLQRCITLVTDWLKKHDKEADLKDNFLKIN